MKKLLFFFAFVVGLMFSNNVHSQCKEFTEQDVMPLLGDYIISGRYNSIRLFEGEEMLIFKTLSKGINYRFVVKGDKEFPRKVEFEVEDWDGNKMFQNKRQNFAEVWDYTCDKPQRIKIYIKVPSGQNVSDPKRGCVSLLTGIKAD